MDVKNFLTKKVSFTTKKFVRSEMYFVLMKVKSLETANIGSPSINYAIT